MKKKRSSSSGSGKISASHIYSILERLKNMKNRSTTNQTYHRIWQSFNKFLVRLDKMPKSWEERTLLYCGHLVDCGHKSSTLKSYISAIKCVVKDDDYEWDDNKVLLGSVTRACKATNDIVKTRAPIHIALLEHMCFEIERLWPNQIYLEKLFKAVLCLGYYGLLRVGELAKSPHVVKAKDIHMGVNKEKILIILFSSKTHSQADPPQEIKITSKKQDEIDLVKERKTRHFCPFKVIDDYRKIRGDIRYPQEQLFVYRDGSPLTIEDV